MSIKKLVLFFGLLGGVSLEASLLTPEAQKAVEEECKIRSLINKKEKERNDFIRKKEDEIDFKRKALRRKIDGLIYLKNIQNALKDVTQMPNFFSLHKAEECAESYLSMIASYDLRMVGNEDYEFLTVQSFKWSVNHLLGDIIKEYEAIIAAHKEFVEFVVKFIKDIDEVKRVRFDSQRYIESCEDHIQRCKNLMRFFPKVC